MMLTRLLLVLTAIVPVGCKVVADANSDTPPRVELKYRVDDASTWTDVDGDTEISIGKKSTLYLYACATHPSGVGHLMIMGGGKQRCNQKGGPKISTYDYYAENRATASVGERTPETLVLAETIEMSELCDKGGPVGSTLNYTATALLFNPTVSAQSGKLSITVVK